MKTYENIRSFDATRKFSPWIYRIAHNAFVNALRKKHREPYVTIDFDILVDHPVYHYDPAEEEERKTMKALVDAGLEMVPALYKEIIILYYLEELSYQEIADVLHVPMGTVSIRLRRGREALKKAIAKNTGSIIPAMDGNSQKKTGSMDPGTSKTRSDFF